MAGAPSTGDVALLWNDERHANLGARLRQVLRRRALRLCRLKALQAVPNIGYLRQQIPHVQLGPWGTIHSQMGAATTGGGEIAIRPAERQATDLLRAAWQRLPDDGGFVTPVNPFLIAERFGITVVNHPLESDMSGMLVKRPTEDPLIYINASDSEVRRRFTCAHELGHYVARTTGRSDDSFGYIDRRGPSAAHGTDPSEVYANQFAAELLMPRENVRALASHLKDAALAVRFNVSLGAMRYRLVNLGISQP
jgi:Zn-dependent peptidase ImmA (M78 family)